MNAPLPGWPPPQETIQAGLDSDTVTPPPVVWNNDLGAPPAWVRAALAAPLPDGALQSLPRPARDVLESSAEAPRTISYPGFVMHFRMSVAQWLSIVALVDALDECLAASHDNAATELMALARRGDEAGFRALAVCVMPLEEVGECWAGARGRLGLPT